MSSATTIVNIPEQSTASLPKNSYLTGEYGLKSWLLTQDHKRIGLLYLISITFFFFIGGAFAGLIRLELLTPMPDLVASDTYNKLFTMHGIVMIFLFLVPSVPAVLGNFLLPLMLGARDLAFPKINLLSWYMYMGGGIFTLATLVLGGVDTGWTFTTPLSTHYVNTHVITAGVGIFIAGFSSIFTGLNFIVTIHRMRCPGMTWFRMPLFLWANYAASILMVLGTPVLAITIVLVALERTIGIGVFDPSKGGDPLLFQHLFWFYSHPAVYIMILPGMGVISETISTFSRKRIFGYTAVAFSSVAIAVFGFFVWEHHMFIMGVSTYSATGVFTAHHAGCRALRDQNLQLGRDSVQGIDHLRNADALFVRLHRIVHYRRPDGRVSGFARYGRAPDRNLLHRRPLPLRDGRRHADGLPGRHPLLVAKDYRTYVSGAGLEARGSYDVYRIHPDVLPAVPARLPRHAASVSCLSA